MGIEQVIDVPKILISMVNLYAIFAGVAVLQILRLAIPAPEGGGKLDTIPGHVGTRLLPFVPVFVAFVATIALEWDGKFSATDGVRGIISGWATEFMLRIYYKTIKGA